MIKEAKFYQKPPGTEVLVRNIERRKRLLERISEKLTAENVKVPEIFIKERTFFRFLIESYKRIRNKTEKEILQKYRIPSLEQAGQKIIDEIKDTALQRIKDFNRRVFVLINRLSLVSKRKEPTTAIVTALYNRPKKGVDLLSDDFKTFLEKVKKLGILIKENNIPLKSITGMQNGLGIPDLEKLEKFIDFIREKNVPIEYITGMQNGLGIPDLEKLEKFIDFIREKNVPIESITGMQHGLGIPDLDKLREFIEFIKNKNLNIKEISARRIGKGIPSIKELEY
jgi:hypothetical protein